MKIQNEIRKKKLQALIYLIIPGHNITKKSLDPSYERLRVSILNNNRYKCIIWSALVLIWHENSEWGDKIPIGLEHMIIPGHISEKSLHLAYQRLYASSVNNNRCEYITLSRLPQLSHENAHWTEKIFNNELCCNTRRYGLSHEPLHVPEWKSKW